jgi:Na+/H+ antiporter NhaB
MPDKRKDYPALVMTAIVWAIFGGFVTSVGSRLLLPLIAHEMGYSFDDFEQQMNWMVVLSLVGAVIGGIVGVVRSLQDPY